MRNTALFIASILIGLLLAEGILRIYNPVETRIRGERITLRTNTVYEMPNFVNDKLAPQLVHSRNNIGFRGPDWPPHNEALRIFAVGGSTTECFYLSDGLDWPAQMSEKLKTLSNSPEAQNQNPDLDKSSQIVNKFWVNNAGLDGHSTFGHSILLNEILADYNPDYILYLVGANDVGRRDLSDHQQTGISGGSSGFSPRRILTRAANYSELGSLIENLLRGWHARARGVVHENIEFQNLPTIEMSQEEIDQTLYINKTWFVPEYRNRLENLIQ